MLFEGYRICVWREAFLTFNFLLHVKAVPKLIGNRFFTPLIYKNPIKAIKK